MEDGEWCSYVTFYYILFPNDDRCTLMFHHCGVILNQWGGGLNPFNPPGKSNTHWTREHRETRDACALTHG